MSKPHDPQGRHQAAVPLATRRFPRVQVHPPAPHQRPARKQQGITAAEHNRMLYRQRFRAELAAGTLGTTQIAAGVVLALTTEDTELLAEIQAVVAGTDREEAVVAAVGGALNELARQAGVRTESTEPDAAERAP